MSRAFACEFGLRGAGLRELRAEVAQLLRIDADIVGAEEEPGLAAILLDLGLGLADPLPKPVDVGAEPARGVAGHVLLRGFLHGEIELGDRVRTLRGKLRVLRAELDGDNARLADRIDQEVLVIVLEHAVFGRAVERVLGKPGENHQPANQADLAGKRVELLVADEPQLLDGVAGEIARHDHLDLARDRLLVDERLLLAAVLGRTGIEAVAALEDELRLAGVAGRHQGDEEDGGREGHDPGAGEEPPAAAQEPRHVAEVHGLEAPVGGVGRCRSGGEGIHRTPRGR